MNPDFDYTTNARSFAHRHPLLTSIGIQVNYWIIAYILLITIMHFNGKSLSSTFGLDIPFLYLPSLLGAVILGIVYGVVLGSLDWYFDRITDQQASLGRIILVRTALYLVVLIVMFLILRYLIWDQFLVILFYEASAFNLNDTSWEYISYLFGIYTVVLSSGVGFINQMNKKFGHGVLIPLLLGKYRQPQEEERLFLFLDLRSSTTHAENLGHLRYSAMIRDCFRDINSVLVKCRGEIYQYVGDEVVVNWLNTSQFQVKWVIDFFFDCQERFHNRRKHYTEQYGFIPEFKAGAHMGMVTAVEVGTLKREIAYHGDTINTASRIQGLCNEYGRSLLISGRIADLLNDQHQYNVESMGSLTLKGKEHHTSIYGVEKLVR